MCRPGVGVANPLFSLWRALWRPTAPACRTKSRRTAEESRTTYDGSRKVENLRRENAAAIELKIVGNLSLYFNFKEIFKNLMLFRFFAKKDQKNEDFSMGKNSLTTKRQRVWRLRDSAVLKSSDQPMVSLRQNLPYLRLLDDLRQAEC